ncbi:MAG: transcriptional regulator [Proteobacteria bacterium]|nr:transcriptional regulator [Pseudomonadota bacterium]
MRILALLVTFGLSAVGFSAMGISGELTKGQLPPPLTLEGPQGARLNGDSWSSAELKGAMTSLFYIDPDERGLNEPLEIAYKKEKFPFDKHRSVAIINMEATWLPNSMIAAKLKLKQKEFPETVYVKDLKKNLVSEWGLKDDSVNLVIFDREGKVAYVKRGPVTEADITEIMQIVRNGL